MSGGADKRLCLWSGQGTLLSCLDIGFQVTALSCSDCCVVAGGAQGELQVCVGCFNLGCILNNMLQAVVRVECQIRARIVVLC